MAESQFHLLDILAVMVPLGLVVMAFLRGIVMEVLLFFAWGLGFALSKWLFPHTQPVVATVVANPMAADMLAIGVVMLPVLLLARYGFQPVTSEINSSRLGNMNKGLGAALGLVRGVMLAWLLVGLMSWSFFRSASAQLYTQQRVTAASLVAEMPVRDILCGTARGNNWSLISQLEQRRSSLSSLAQEIVAFYKAPDSFPVLQVSRTVSSALCAKG